jgi:hypothetical protein
VEGENDREGRLKDSKVVQITIFCYDLGKMESNPIIKQMNNGTCVVGCLGFLFVDGLKSVTRGSCFGGRPAVFLVGGIAVSLSLS